MNKTDEDAWEFLEELSEKTMQWDSCENKPIVSTVLTANMIAARSGIHTVESSIASEAKLAALSRRIEDLETEKAEATKQAPTLGCYNCQSPRHVFDECPLLQSSFALPLELLNAMYQRPGYDPWSSTYNPGWRHHPNLSWTQGAHQGVHQQCQGGYQQQQQQGGYQGGYQQENLQQNVAGQQFQRPTAGLYQYPNAFVNQQYHQQPAH